MSFLEKLGIGGSKEEREARSVQKLQKKILEKFGPPENRQGAIEELGEMHTQGAHKNATSQGGVFVCSRRRLARVYSMAALPRKSASIFSNWLRCSTSKIRGLASSIEGNWVSRTSSRRIT